MTEEAVFFKIDKEKTSVDTYTNFNEDVLMKFAEEVTARDNRTLKLSKADPNIAAQAAELGAFFVKSVTAMMVYDYINGKLNSDEAGNTVYQSGDGPVYIEELNVISRDEAEHRLPYLDEEE